MKPSHEDPWLTGWDETPGIVSVWAEPDGRAIVWRRLPGSLALVRETTRFRPWLVATGLEDFRHLGALLRPESERLLPAAVTYQELEGPGALRFLLRADDGRTLTRALVRGASTRLGRTLGHVRELGDAVLVLPPEEQYLVSTGRSYFRGLGFDDLRRLQLDLETTGLDPERDRIFLVAVRDPEGRTHTLELEGGLGDSADAADAGDAADAAEADLLRRVVACVASHDPDVIENHNLHGFDLPFLARRARNLGVPLTLGREAGMGLAIRPASRGATFARGTEARAAEPLHRGRYTVAGRELVDTLDAVLRHDFSARDLPGHGLKAVAKHFGLASPTREYVPGARVFEVYERDPERVRRYACDDVNEVAALARMLGGAAFALARLTPRRYERLADAGAATGVIDPLLVRAYLHAGAALPRREPGDGTPHVGAALHLFATGVAHRIVKADVASLYPSLMREYRIGPARDRLGALLGIVDRLVEQRLAAKARARALPPGSAERHTDEALSAAMKLVVNSAYGYLGAVGLTRFADVHAANEVTRRGREVLALLCRELDARGVTLLEADTDGVYFAVPASFGPDDERRVVDEVGALLPSLVKLEFEGRYAAMLSHEPKNYALLTYDGELVLRGVAFRSRRAEPFGESFLRRALVPLLASDLAGVRDAYVAVVTALRARALPTRDVTSEVRLTKTRAQYEASAKKELPYEAMLAAGHRDWAAGERVRVYRAAGPRAGLYAPRASVEESPAEGGADDDPRDYDVEHYARLLRRTFSARLARAMTPQDYAAVFADPEQLSLFEPSLVAARPILRVLAWP